VKLNGEWIWVAYAEFLRMVYGLRGGLAHLGVGRGDAVVVVARNCLEWAVTCYATSGLGAVFVPIDPALGEDAWRFILADSRASVAVGVSAAVAGALGRIRPGVPTLAHVVGVTFPRSDPRSWAGLLEAGWRRPAGAADPAPSEPAVRLYAAASEQLSGATVTHGAITAAVHAVGERLDLSPDDRSLGLRPWSETFARACELHSVLVAGGSTAIDDAVDDLPLGLAEIRPTLLFTTPALLERLAALAAQAGSRARRWLLHAAIGPAVRRARGQPISALPAGMLALADRVVLGAAAHRLGGRLRRVVTDVMPRPEAVDLFAALGVQVVAVGDKLGGA
jgi:long-chain acyl-CoA synthetase